MGRGRPGVGWGWFTPELNRLKQSTRSSRKERLVAKLSCMLPVQGLPLCLAFLLCFGLEEAQLPTRARPPPLPDPSLPPSLQEDIGDMKAIFRRQLEECVEQLNVAQVGRRGGAGRGAGGAATKAHLT